MINIMLLINSFNCGGAEKLCYDYAKNIDKKEFNVFVCSMGECKSDVEHQFKNDLEQAGIKTIVVGKPRGKKKLWSIIRIVMILKNNKIDVLHTNGISPDFYGRIASLFVKKASVVVTIHDDKGYSDKTEHILTRLTRKYIAISDNVYLYCIDSLKISKGKIKIIYNAIDTQKYLKKTCCSNRNELGIPEDAYVVISVARVAPEKNYLLMFEEMSRTMMEDPDIYWIIVGDYQEHHNYCLECSSKMKPELLERVRMIGVSTEVPKYLNMADCYYQASVYEGFGISYIEAMASGLPIISTNVGVIRHVIGNGGKVNLIDNNCLRTIIRNIKNQKIDADINKNIVERFYNIKIATAKLEEIYRECVNE